MSRKTIVLIIIIILGLVIGGLFGFYFYLYRQQGNNNQAARPSSFFGLFNRTPSTPVENTSTTTVFSTPTSTPSVKMIPRLRKITSEPIAGADFAIKDIYASTTPNSTSTKAVAPKVIGKQEIIRWMERGTGNIFETATSTLFNTRLSNSTISQVQEAYFTDKGDSVIYRRLVGTTDSIETKFGKLQQLTSTSTAQALTTTGLPLNILNIAISPDKTKVFMINDSDPRGQIAKTDGASKTTVFTSELREWLPEWPALNSIILTTKPSGTVEGYSYIFNPQTRSFIKILGNKLGLTTLVSPDTNQILYAESYKGAYQLAAYDRKTNKETQLFVKTFPEKCVWSKLEKDTVYCAVPENMPYATYPDLWYQGRVSFTDSLWKINTKTTETRQILRSFQETDESIDMTNLTLSAKEDYILFKNKFDLALWGYQLIVPTIRSANATSSTATTTKR